MQQHEGPRRDRGAEERIRQAGLTRHLLIAVGVLATLLVLALGLRLI